MNSLIDEKKRYRIFLFIMLMALFNYIDRGAISYSAGAITGEYGFDRAQWGSLLGYFGYGYMCGALLGGFLSDSLGPRKIWKWAGSIWSILAICTAFAGDVGLVLFSSALLGFAMVRIVFGFAEGPAYSAINKSISVWALPKERGFVVALGLVSTPLGALLTAPVATALLHFTGSWRSMFIILGSLNLCLIWYFLRIFTDRPADNRFISEAEKSYIDSELRSERKSVPAAPSASASASDLSDTPIPWWHYFLNHSLVLNAVAYFAFMYVNFLLLTWTPKYLQDQFGFNLSSLWYLGMIPWVGACVTVLLGGRISDAIFKRTGSLYRARSVFAAACLLVTSVVFYMVSVSSSPWIALGLIAVANAMNSLANSVYWAVVIDTAPRSRTGTFSGITHAIANTAAIIAPTLTGYLTLRHGYSAMFTAAAVATGVGVVAMLLVRPGLKPGKA
ncbi:MULTISPECIES: MFS transporter [Comamonas]|uniref:MFS transporter n=1 Tax=Comamonas TaxID=283 RepID=UPI00050FFA62|nr:MULTISPECIES: MFS transporter [Comamonas]KGG82410.1 MFS transporter [Comamonas thiooxydans]GAO72042.1 putative galactarate transporter [Comamonas sp. E6]